MIFKYGTMFLFKHVTCHFKIRQMTHPPGFNQTTSCGLFCCQTLVNFFFSSFCVPCIDQDLLTKKRFLFLHLLKWIQGTWLGQAWGANWLHQWKPKRSLFVCRSLILSGLDLWALIWGPTTTLLRCVRPNPCPTNWINYNNFKLNGD